MAVAETPKNDNDMLRMQQEAIRRVRMMQQRAQKTVVDPGHEPTRPQQETPRPQQRNAGNNRERPHREQTRPAQPPARRRYAARPQSNPLSALFSRGKESGESLISSLFEGDSERTMLIILLIILIDEHSDMSLILSLLYMIL